MRRRSNPASTLRDLQRGGPNVNSTQAIVPTPTPPATGIGVVGGPQIREGAVEAAALAPGSFDLTKFASGIRPVSIVTSLPTLPDAGYPDDSVVVLTTDHKLYRNAAGTWTAAVPTVDLTGQVSEAQITDLAVSTTKIASGAVRADKLVIGNFDNLIESPGFEQGLVSWQPEGGWAVVVDAANGRTGNRVAKIPSASSTVLIALRVHDKDKAYLTDVSITSIAATNTYARLGGVATVPASGAYAALLVYISGIGLTSRPLVDCAPGQKFYVEAYVRWDGTNTWADDCYMRRVVGTTIIEDGAISTAKLAAGAVTANEIAANTITAAKIAADTITAGEIAAGAITASELAANAVTAAKILAGEITTSKLNVVTILVDNATWTDNSPSAGYVAWSGATVYYQGLAYAITNGNTALKYIWWSKTTTNTTFQSSNTRPTLTDDEFLVATNSAGVHDIAWNAPANTGVFPGHLSFDAMASLFIYGDGIDGDVTIASGTTTLTRDMSYNNLTINGGAILVTNGFRVFVKNTLLNNGTIRHNGANGTTPASGSATGGALGAGAAQGNMGGGADGSVGANGGNNATAGSGVTNGLGSTGGTSGKGSGPNGTPGGGSGAAGGAITTTLANRHGLVLLSDSAEVRGGAGGAGSGAGSSTVSGVNLGGGGGGGGGGAVVIAARTITNNGTISANGGNGGNGAPSLNPTLDSAAGGAGGGSGGAVVLVYRALVQGTVTASGGAGGTKSYTTTNAANGAAGSAGLVLLIQQEA